MTCKQYEVNDSVRLNKYPKHDTFVCDTEIQRRISGPCNIGHSDLQKYEVTRSRKLKKYPQNDAYLSSRARYIRQKSQDHKI